MRRRNRTQRECGCQEQIRPAEVHSLAESIMTRSLKLEAHGYRCTTTVLLQVLYWAAARCVSISAACVSLAQAPGDQTIRDALRACLPKRPKYLEDRINKALTADVPRALCRRARRIAIDWHQIPYHGSGASLQANREPRCENQSAPARSSVLHHECYRLVAATEDSVCDSGFAARSKTSAGNQTQGASSTPEGPPRLVAALPAFRKNAREFLRLYLLEDGSPSAQEDGPSQSHALRLLASERHAERNSRPVSTSIRNRSQLPSVGQISYPHEHTRPASAAVVRRAGSVAAKHLGLAAPDETRPDPRRPRNCSTRTAPPVTTCRTTQPANNTPATSTIPIQRNWELLKLF